MKQLILVYRIVTKSISLNYLCLWEDFATFVKVSLTDGHSAISTQEAKERVSKAIAEVEQGTAKTLFSAQM